MIDEQYGNCPPLLSLKYPPRAVQCWAGQPASGGGRGDWLSYTLGVA